MDGGGLLEMIRMAAGLYTYMHITTYTFAYIDRFTQTLSCNFWLSVINCLQHVLKINEKNNQHYIGFIIFFTMDGRLNVLICIVMSVHYVINLLSFFPCYVSFGPALR